MNANELPRYTGLLFRVQIKYINVPKPDETNVTGIDNIFAPAVVFTTIGTRIVAPNIAHTCWRASKIHLSEDGLSPVSSIILLFSSTIHITKFHIFYNYIIFMKKRPFS